MKKLKLHILNEKGRLLIQNTRLLILYSNLPK